MNYPRFAPMALRPIRLLLTLFLCFSLFSIKANGQSKEAEIMTHVNHIEEFIDRFNYDPKSAFQRYVEENFPDSEVDRKLILRSLIDKENAIFDSQLADAFIDAIANPLNSVKLNIYDALWYAKIPISFEVGKTEYTADIALEIQLNDDYSIEWTIIGIQSDFLNNYENNKDMYIAASSHATYFPELRKALKSSALFQDVMSNNKDHSNVERFKNFLEESSIDSVRILKGLSYHFLQISGWIMVVKYVDPLPNESINTGWLIHELYQVASSREKMIYRKDQLGIY